MLAVRSSLAKLARNGQRARERRPWNRTVGQGYALRTRGAEPPEPPAKGLRPLDPARRGSTAAAGAGRGRPAPATPRVKCGRTSTRWHARYSLAELSRRRRSAALTTNREQKRCGARHSVTRAVWRARSKRVASDRRPPHPDRSYGDGAAAAPRLLAGTGAAAPAPAPSERFRAIALR